MQNDAKPVVTVARMEDLHGYFIEELATGMTDVCVRTITETDIIQYSQVSGDNNPLHMNEQFAKKTIFKGCIAHGMLACGYISSVFGTKLPGPGCAFINQNLNFRSPVRVGDTVQTRVTIKEILKDSNQVYCEIVCSVEKKIVIDGTALLWVPNRGREN
tara:strand:- start:1159 stop:1635 length:477 start_codon:yes stop_codon:yes gene_type:complete